MGKEGKSLAELGAEMSNKPKGEHSKIETVEMTALLTVIREGLKEEGRTFFTARELTGRCFDLTETVLFEEEVYRPNKISHGVNAIWDLIGNGHLTINPDRSLTVSPGFKRTLLETLPNDSA